MAEQHDDEALHARAVRAVTDVYQHSLRSIIAAFHYVQDQIAVRDGEDSWIRDFLFIAPVLAMGVGAYLHYSQEEPPAPTVVAWTIDLHSKYHFTAIPKQKFSDIELKTLAPGWSDTEALTSNHQPRSDVLPDTIFNFSHVPLSYNRHVHRSDGMNMGVTVEGYNVTHMAYLHLQEPKNPKDMPGWPLTDAEWVDLRTKIGPEPDLRLRHVMISKQAGNRLSLSRLVDQGVVMTMEKKESDGNMLLSWNGGRNKVVARRQEDSGDWVVGLQVRWWEDFGGLKQFELKQT